MILKLILLASLLLAWSPLVVYVVYAVRVSDPVLQSIIAGVVTLTPVLLAYMQHRTTMAVKTASDVAKTASDAANAATQRAAMEVREVKETVKIASDNAVTAAEKVQEVAEKTDAKLENIEHVTQSVHTLVNSAMSTQLKLNAVMARRLADITKGTHEGHADEEAAKLAEQLYSDHEAKQNIVDAGKTIKS